ncbi:MAG: DNA-binding response regulator [Symploca sp. SIO2G7]|nr:DNA-binding response regulator [Symploca sp. SIO2G7]
MVATSEQIKEILILRDRKVAPKQIARKLGLRPAEVNDIICTELNANPEKNQPKKLPKLKECLIDSQGFDRFFGSQNTRKDRKGLSQILVARTDGSHYLVTTFLIDAWCLGVKNAMGSRKVKTTDYPLMREQAYATTMEDSYRTISLEQAQSVIYGAVNYAKHLGIDPHKDFERAKKNLGPRMETLARHEFGKNGRPYYFAGPYDNPEKILAKLRESVGEGNFHYTIGMDLGMGTVL